MADVKVPHDVLEKLERLVAVDEIRSALVRYCRGIDRVVPRLIADAYGEESWDEHGPFQGTGREFAYDSGPASVRAGATNLSSHHLLGQSDVVIDGSSAAVETYFWCTGIRLSADGAERRHYRLAGRYLDQFDRLDGQWRIRRRVVVVDWSGESPEPASWAPGAAFRSGGRWPDDLVFGLPGFTPPTDK